MSVRFVEETKVYDHYDTLLGQIEEGDSQYFPSFRAVGDAEITIEELKEIADYLESL